MAESGEEDKARWQQLSTLLDEALALAPAARAAWLEQLPPQFAGLLPSLKRMLADDSPGAGEFLSRPVTLPKVLRGMGDPADVEGNDIGPYRLISELGSGGMGTVWIAERSDGSLKRQVALKLPVSQWAPNLVERMRRERDILATLEHPNIARLYDAGMTDEGRPYLALEYVEGKPIDVFCREHRLSVEDRLKLFLQVAQAVSHAHSRLVVHRDLKPNNILVMQNGDVRLLDFGIAKLLSDDDGDAGAPSQLTHMAGRALTLDYASPEQIRSERITIASDVYSLGVVLFELLTGQRPYKLKRKSAGAIEDAIIEQESPTASSVADSGTAKILRGDLDVILAKALKKEVASRYPSVESFAGDISRYLAGQPVLAQPDSTWYRTRKFLRRNARAVAAAAAIMLAVSAGAGVALWQARVARMEADRADAAKHFIASIFTSAVPRAGVGGEVIATDLLATAAQRIEKELPGDPQAAAELGVIIAESFDALGVPAKGEAVVRRALERAEAVYGTRHPVTLRGRLQLAKIVKDRDATAAEPMFAGIIVDAKADLPRNAELAAVAMRLRSFVLAKRDAAEESYAALKESIALAEKYLGPESDQAITGIGLLANTYGRFAKRDAQLDSATEAMRRAAKAYGPQRPHPLLTNAERWYAEALTANDRAADAIPLLRLVLADQRRLDAAETLRVRNAMHQLANALFFSGQLDEAIPLARQVVEMEKAQNDFDSEDRLNFGVASARTLLAARRIDEASVEQARVHALLQRLKIVTPRHLLGLALLDAQLSALRGNYAEAERIALEAARGGTDHPVYRADALRVAVMNARLQRRFAQSETLQAELAAMESPQFVSLRNRSENAAEKGTVALEAGHLDVAEKHFDECHALYEKAQVRLSVRVSTCVIGLARVQLRRNHPAKAINALKALSADWEKVNPASEWHGETLYWLARAEAQMGQTADAAASAGRARALLRKSNLPAFRYLLDQSPLL